VSLVSLNSSNQQLLKKVFYLYYYYFSIRNVHFNVCLIPSTAELREAAGTGLVAKSSGSLAIR
ncbi:uncharacterized protein LOC108665339, partial [Hyalella azteca]|uniref:Uncharacterized protein LOC108665339 n=1 Tax=Hyalella azteca TaxID=294128 RepID=A0A8B7N2X4_HYAAZ